MASRLDRYAAILADLGIHPTWPATACVLARHPALLRAYAETGAELAVHGLVHGDHARLDRSRQRETIARAADIFARAGIAAVGFRGPYLRYNAATLEVLRELGFRYHSSQAIAFPLVIDVASDARLASYERALQLYSALDARRTVARPRMLDRVVDIPVAVPDDEILVERLRVDEAAATAQWLAMLDATYERGDLFTIQLHPERIAELSVALATTLRDARRREPGVFIARLDEIASWWLRRSAFSLRVLRTGAGRYRVQLTADDDATLLVRGLAVPGVRSEDVCTVRDFEVEAPRVPMAAVSRRSPAAVRDLLAEEGVPFEVSDDRGRYGAFVDVADGSDERAVLTAIEAAPGPLVRLGRWPRGARSALAVTGDIDALTIFDFAVRSWETRETRGTRDTRGAAQERQVA
jgi:peptidoglycan/xylan/chitin deacetylase (PgdA/CDA1 family)